jgi:hypothetical protein
MLSSTSNSTYNNTMLHTGMVVSCAICTSPAPAAQVREIGNQVTPEPFRWTAEALLALQEVRNATIHSTASAASC